MVWLIGYKGMLGSEVARQLTENKIRWIGSGSEVDITDSVALSKFARDHGTEAGRTGISVARKTVPEKITWVINCAAYTAVDKAETEIDSAEKLNAEGPKNVARITRELGAKLIHISTDYVFDGSGNIPYTEDMPKCPVSVYGKTKALGEDFVEKEMTQYYILRTSWLYGFDGGNFVYTMAKNMNVRDELCVVSDQKGTPTCAVDLAALILKIMCVSEKAKSLFGKKSALPYGIYNFSNLGETTWFDFARKIYELGKKYGKITRDCTVNSCASEEYPTAAARPAYSVLSKEKIQSALKIKIPEWQDSLEKFIKSERFMPSPSV
ncbi:dTDP-4-dehydrorhamnose reductase [Treponema sp.]|uniref:dTDP-4-dehydrorhamnose reductase n=1 Tax=Treponema sp. TaxID=166 RepID=UPI003F080927